MLQLVLQLSAQDKSLELPEIFLVETEKLTGYYETPILSRVYDGKCNVLFFDAGIVDFIFTEWTTFEKLEKMFPRYFSIGKAIKDNVK
jgi:prepilin-type processing-associated H-X9-DG protein